MKSNKTAGDLLWDALQQGPAPLVALAVPSLIVMCNTTEDAARAVRWARSSGTRVAARGSGHNFAGVALVQGGLTIDLSGLKVQTTQVQPLIVSIGKSRICTDKLKPEI